MQYAYIFLAVCSTLLGGVFVFRYKHVLNRILGFTAGVVLGVVVFDLLPEIIDHVNSLGISSRYPMIAIVIGFLLFHIAEKVLLVHHAHEDQYGSHEHPHSHPSVGVLSAGALIFHSILDGVAIGVGFAISSQLGIAVAIAVIAHDFADGMNTVSVMLAHKNPIKRIKRFLIVDALAPVVGVVIGSTFAVSEMMTVVYLGFFAGFLLYIGASEILPEAHSRDSSLKTVLATVVGVLFIFIVTGLIQ